MYILITIILVITAYIIGYKSSTNRLKADDISWLTNRLLQLGVSIPTAVEESKSPPVTNKSKGDSTLDEIVNKQKNHIKHAFLTALKDNLSRGNYSFDNHNEAYSLIPDAAVKAHLSLLINEFMSANPSIQITGNLLYSEYRGKNFIRIVVKVVK